ncbi:hypothetical protein BCS42_09245 [Crenothrix sp. D3]|nr:hypothetical protein BCS42_09245 [Crenothrix sp. D3]
MKKIMTAFSVATLLCASSAFADEPSTYSTKSFADFATQKTANASAITAFQDINSSHVSPTELNQVSGEGLRGMGLGPLGWLIKRNVQNPVKLMTCPKGKCVEHKA